MENLEQNNNEAPKISIPLAGGVITGANVQSKKSNSMAILASVAVIIILVISGLYVWGSQFNSENIAGIEKENKAVETPKMNGTTENRGEEKIVSQNDDLDSLETEANSTEIESSGDLDYSFDQE